MTVSTIVKTHPSIIHNDEMQRICKPLFKLGITYFGHARIDQFGELTTNATNPNFLEEYYNSGYFNCDLHIDKTISEGKYVLWDLITLKGSSARLYKIGVEFGLSHTFSIIEQTGLGKNYYHFATKPGNQQMNNFYLQHIDLFENFIAYFKDQLLINDTLNQAYTLKQKLLKQNYDFSQKNSGSFNQEQRLMMSFLQDIGYKNTLIQDHPKKLSLSRRETQCASLLLDGMTSKEIAKQLNLSARTVETYFDRLKEKFGSKNKLSLISQILQHGLKSEV